MTTANNGHATKGSTTRRAVESTYHRTITEACPPDTWREICDAAVSAARSGDAKARDFLARHLIGHHEPNALAELEAWDIAGRDKVAERGHNLGLTDMDRMLESLTARSH